MPPHPQTKNKADVTQHAYPLSYLWAEASHTCQTPTCWTKTWLCFPFDRESQENYFWKEYYFSGLLHLKPREFRGQPWLAFQVSRPPREGCLLPLPLSKPFSLSLFFNFTFNWKIVTLQYYDGFCHISTWISHGYTYAPLALKPPSHLILHPIPLDYHRVPALDSQHHTANSPWLSILHMVMYICLHPTLSSHSHLSLPHCSCVCSLHLCLFCCLQIGSSVPSF